ncbi:hypothetical protein TcasGA2_TC012541 [Tribolium castaneum]|uniref:Uncharacterized protein n=1 Tax=Tribolium castaneum TaxID=7070 RepID=D6X344_TRICA|nr:hypothetical protein TcasGA2_TC012541 [Tribolium castaneum]
MVPERTLHIRPNLSIWARVHVHRTPTTFWIIGGIAGTKMSINVLGQLDSQPMALTTPARLTQPQSRRIQIVTHCFG